MKYPVSSDNSPGRFRLLQILVPLAMAVMPVFVSPLAQAEDTPASTTTISGEQADAILEELKAIRSLLEKIEKQGIRTPQRPARPTTASVAIEGQPAMGEAGAPVTVVEFTDYQCPYCLRFTKTTFPHLKKKYIDTGKVRWLALNLPLAFHPHARKAAQAALCAGDQGKFWEMRTHLFQNPKKLDTEHLQGYAGELSLDGKAFEACLNSDRHLADIDREAQAANAVRLTGTPSFIIGKSDGKKVSGRVIVGAQPLSAFDSAITQALAQ